MSDSQDKKDIDQKPAPEASSEASPLANTEFMREKIKQRPINRKKLLRRTIITVSLAAVFGLVACITFLILEPVINNALYPEEKPKTVSFPEESASDELQPEQMYANEAAIEAQAAASAQYSAEVSTEKEVQQAISSYSFDASDYSEMYTSLHKTAVEASKSIVTVTGVTSDTDWINDAYEKSGSYDVNTDAKLKKHRKHKFTLYYRAPMFLRAWLWFMYNYYIKLGFLDGREGYLYNYFECYWYRFLVDAKIYESRLTGAAPETLTSLKG